MNKKLIKSKAFVLGVIISINIALNIFPINQETAQKIEHYEMAEMIRVIDGDTLLVDLNGVEERVRLIGVDTPESVGKYKNNPEPGGEEAAQYVKELLPEGSMIYLTDDVENRDYYGRLLRYVWLDPPEGEPCYERMVNFILLETGHAEIMEVPPNIKYAEVFKKLK